MEPVDSGSTTVKKIAFLYISNILPWGSYTGKLTGTHNAFCPDIVA